MQLQLAAPQKGFLLQTGQPQYTFTERVDQVTENRCLWSEMGFETVE